jgi:hypothetical protein
MRLTRLASAAFAATLLVPASAGPAEAMPDAACRIVACTTTLMVDEEPVRWASIEWFYPNNEDLGVTLVAGGRTLRLASSGGVGGCRQSYRGAGLGVTVRACGSETPLLLRAKRRKPTGISDLTVTYLAVPFLDGE